MSTTVKRLPPDQPVVITANRLTDGSVVWLAEGARWVERLAAATPMAGPEAEAALAFAKREEAARRVVGAYAAPVLPGATGPQPASERERIRAAGPSTLAA